MGIDFQHGARTEAITSQSFPSGTPYFEVELKLQQNNHRIQNGFLQITSD